MFWKQPAYACYVMVMYLACDTFMENHFTTLDSTFFLKMMPENQGHSGRLTVNVQTLWPQDVFTNQIWYARGTIFLDLMAVVKVRDAPWP